MLSIRLLWLLATGVVGIGGGLMLGAAIDSAPAASAPGPRASAPAPASATPTRDRDASPRRLPEASGATRPAAPVAAGFDRNRFAAALRDGGARAERLGGEVEAAVWAPGWSAPVTVGRESRRMRMWSMSKPLTALGIYRAGAPDDQTVHNMTRAITRSENCPQRSVVLRLQEVAGGPAGAARSLEALLRTSGASVDVPTEARTGTCPTGSRPALQLGTTLWTVHDAVSFAHALGDGRFGPFGQRVLHLMGQPKHMSEEAMRGTHTMDPDFGAGKSLKGFRPAYKSGWGGSGDRNFLVGQFGVAEVGGQPVAFAVMFHPLQQPPRDDPGIDPNDQALERVLDPVAAELRRAAG
jgi:hypothetical protein